MIWTPLPYSDYHASARALDRHLLSQQRSVNLEIMTALLRGTGRVNSPAAEMWRRYEWALLSYQHAICAEWIERGHRDVFWDRTKALCDRYLPKDAVKAWPYWSASERLHMSHQSELLRRDYTYYIQLFPSAPVDMEVVWPETISDYKQVVTEPWWIPNESF